MSSSATKLQEHADMLMLEPQSPARDIQIKSITEQAIRICNRIKDSNSSLSSTVEHDSVDSSSKKIWEEEQQQRLVRLYDLRSIAMTEGQDAESLDSKEYASALIEKGDALSEMADGKTDAASAYDQALLFWVTTPRCKLLTTRSMLIKLLIC